jgi:hypothetical protein
VATAAHAYQRNIGKDKRTYYGEHLSDNIRETPEGFIVCENTVIGRTGYQIYRVGEILDPEGLLAAANYSNPAEEIKLYRDPEQVFHPDTLASFEGKSFTVSHPDELVSSANYKEHEAGQVTNVRQGTEPLESGDYPLLADIVVKDENAINAILAGERELSCGYTYKLAREGYRWDQRQIIGNHVALVPKGRAGSEARIYDAAPKEKPVKNFTDAIKSLLARGLQSAAKDASSEEFAKLVEHMGNPSVETKEEPAVVKTTETPKLVCIGLDKASGKKVFMSEEDLATRVIGKDGVEEENMSKRKEMHDALDRMMDKEEGEEHEKKEMEDAAVSKLKGIMDKFFPNKDAKEEEKEEEKTDDAHPEDCDCEDCMKAKDAMEKEEPEGKDNQIVNPEPVLATGEVPKNALDVAKDVAIDARGTLTLMFGFKPILARTKDKTAIKAFDTILRGVHRLAKSAGTSADGVSSTKGGYAAFRVAVARPAEDHISVAKDNIHRDSDEAPAVMLQRELDNKYAESFKNKNLKKK